MPTTTTQLTGVIADHVKAVNAFDTEAVVATFAADAYINDVSREIHGTDAIRRFVAKEIVGDNVTMDVTEAIDHHGDTIVRATYDGDFDKADLPNPLILTNYFSVRDNKIVSLITILNKPSECDDTMTVSVPAPLDAYIEATNNRDAEMLVGLFGEDAVVRDEGQEYRGLEGVHAWRAKSQQSYTYTVEPKSVVERDGLTVLTATVEGSFPGSPVDLDFDFTLRDGRIVGLAIHR
jgi:ketosteroid isomerase-like protein